MYPFIQVKHDIQPLENDKIRRKVHSPFSLSVSRSQNCDFMYHFVCSILVRPLHIGVVWVVYLTICVSLFPFSDINEASCGIYKVLRPMYRASSKLCVGEERGTQSRNHTHLVPYTQELLLSVSKGFCGRRDFQNTGIQKVKTIHQCCMSGEL